MSTLQYATYLTLAVGTSAAISATTLSALDNIYIKSTDRIQHIAQLNLEQTIQNAVIEHAISEGLILEANRYTTIVKLVKAGKLSEKTLTVVEENTDGTWKVKQLTSDIDLSDIPTQ